MRNVITRQQAIDLGLKRYFTGTKCSRGHISERRVSDRHCILCNVVRQKNFINKHGKRTYKPDIRQHLWNKLNSVKSQRKSTQASKMEINKNEFFKWLDKNYKDQCEYCGISLEKYETSKLFIKYKVPGHRFGIDRKNSLGSYNLDNIAVCCSICNSAKSFVFDAEEFKEIAQKYIRKLYG